MLSFEELLARGTSASATANTGPAPSASSLLKQMERMQRKIVRGEACAPRGPLEVRESPLATQTAPAKRHKKRRNQTEAYHRRVQKKWTKRWGTKQVPAAYVVDNSAIGGRGQTLVAHPSIVAALKALNQ